jgi:hypothetical protein
MRKNPWDPHPTIHAGVLAALQMAGNPRDLLIETKTRMFAA